MRVHRKLSSTLAVSYPSWLVTNLYGSATAHLALMQAVLYKGHCPLRQSACQRQRKAVAGLSKDSGRLSPVPWRCKHRTTKAYSNPQPFLSEVCPTASRVFGQMTVALVRRAPNSIAFPTGTQMRAAFARFHAFRGPRAQNLAVAMTKLVVQGVA